MRSGASRWSASLRAIHLAMTVKETFEPGWQQRHMQRYLDSNGEDGHIWEGAPTVLITTTGSISGQPRTTPLIYQRDGERLVLVASKGGAPKHPSWYVNMKANPNIEVQLMGDRFKARVR